jgi:battenin
MLAVAPGIAAGAVGEVVLAAILPGLALKMSAGFLVDRVPYSVRAVACAALMAAAYVGVGGARRRGAALAGVAAALLQGALGEASALTRAGRARAPRRALTAWSSGTGAAGVAGYAWVAGLTLGAGWSLRCALAAANITVAGWLAVYFLLLPPLSPLPGADEKEGDGGGGEAADGEAARLLGPGRAAAGRAPRLGARARAALLLSLWPLIAPLALVYCAEYALQVSSATASLTDQSKQNDESKTTSQPAHQPTNHQPKCRPACGRPSPSPRLPPPQRGAASSPPPAGPIRRASL